MSRIQQLCNDILPEYRVIPNKEKTSLFVSIGILKDIDFKAKNFNITSHLIVLSVSDTKEVCELLSKTTLDDYDVRSSLCDAFTIETTEKGKNDLFWRLAEWGFTRLESQKEFDVIWHEVDKMIR